MASERATGMFRRKRQLPKRTLLACSSVLAILLTLCYRAQPDLLAELTLVPPWLWLVPAIVLLTLGRGRRHWRWMVAAGAFWLLFVVLVIDELPGLLRYLVGANSNVATVDETTRLRVVSLNCYFGKAAAEVKRYQPDIVLFQESPNAQAVAKIARDLFGEEGASLWNVDTSIVCRGRIRDPLADPQRPFVLATVVMPDGTELEVASTRLNPPIFRVDLWAPSCWIDHRNNRRLHRRQVEELVNAFEKREAFHPMIAGGDMNSPANDAALWPLRKMMIDTFSRAGVGWGNTGPTDYPFWRVDQIWASPQLEAARVVVEPVETSDHRMVICDFVWPPRHDE